MADPAPKAKKQRKARDPNAPKKTRAPKGPPSELEIELKVMLLRGQQTKAQFAKKAGVTTSKLQSVIIGKEPPPADWVANTNIPIILRKAAAEAHRAAIVQQYNALIDIFPDAISDGVEMQSEAGKLDHVKAA